MIKISYNKKKIHRFEKKDYLWKYERNKLS